MSEGKVSVGEVQAETIPAETPAAQVAQPGTKRPEPDEVRLILRRDDDRRERLWVD